MKGTLVVADVGIRQDTEGRYCLNDLHRSAGGEKKHGPSYWLANEQTKELIAELSVTGNPVTAKEQALKIYQGGTNQGTYVCKELVYAYAMWISATFHLKVIRAYDAMVSRPAADPMQALNDPTTMRSLLLNYSEKVIALENKNAELAPKAEALDRIAAADGSTCVTNAAKDLQVRPKALFDFLSQNKWIYRRQGGTGWIAYQDKLQKGLVEHKVTVVSRGDGTEKVTEQVLITARGLARLAEIINPGPLRQVAGGAQ